jgi:hypothetical protein
MARLSASASPPPGVCRTFAALDRKNLVEQPALVLGGDAKAVSRTAQ